MGLGDFTLLLTIIFNLSLQDFPSFQLCRIDFPFQTPRDELSSSWHWVLDLPLEDEGGSLMICHTRCSVSDSLLSSDPLFLWTLDLKCYLLQDPALYHTMYSCIGQFPPFTQRNLTTESFIYLVTCEQYGYFHFAAIVLTHGNGEKSTNILCVTELGFLTDFTSYFQV